MSTILEHAVAEGRDELSYDEATAYVEAQTRQYFDLSVEGFIVAAEFGLLPEDDPMVIHLAILTGARLATLH